MKSKRLVLVGDSAFSEIAYEYFQMDSDKYEVVGFAVERDFMKRQTFCGLPVVPFEEVESHFSCEGHEVFVAVVYTQLNRLRARLMGEAKAKGYRLASFVSPRAFVWRNVEIGEHCFIFEDNTLQPFVRVGNNVVLWSGNHIGHHSIIRDNCFISSHVVISGVLRHWRKYIHGCQFKRCQQCSHRPRQLDQPECDDHEGHLAGFSIQGKAG